MTRQLTFWTADTEGNTQVKKWLDDELEGDQLPSLASFVNKCSQLMQRLKNAQAKWLSIAEKERAFNVREVL
jgi:hypothetical protein